MPNFNLLYPANRNEGYKFETLSLIPHPWDGTSREYIENREREMVDNYAQYCSIVRTGIGKSRLILGGEVDAGKLNIAFQARCILIA